LSCGPIVPLVARPARIVAARLYTYRPSPCPPAGGRTALFPSSTPGAFRRPFREPIRDAPRWPACRTRGTHTAPSEPWGSKVALLDLALGFGPRRVSAGCARCPEGRRCSAPGARCRAGRISTAKMFVSEFCPALRLSAQGLSSVSGGSGGSLNDRPRPASIDPSKGSAADRPLVVGLLQPGCDRGPSADFYLVRRKPTLVSCLPYRSQTAAFPDFDTSRVIVSETDRTTWVTSGMRALLS
jgi:hypothetical protein